jgi:hypothetical protein
MVCGQREISCKCHPEHSQLRKFDLIDINYEIKSKACEILRGLSLEDLPLCQDKSYSCRLANVGSIGLKNLILNKIVSDANLLNSSAPLRYSEFVTKPWTVSASTLTSRENFSDIFNITPKKIKSDPVSKCIDKYLGSIFDNGEDIQQKVTFDFDGMKIPIYALPDAIYTCNRDEIQGKFVIEFKTVRTARNIPLMLQRALRQVSAYTLMDKKDEELPYYYLMVVIVLKTKKCSILQIFPENST